MTPKSFLCPLVIHPSLHSCPRQPLICFLFHRFVCILSRTLCKWNYTVCILWAGGERSLVSLPLPSDFEVLPFRQMCQQFVSFYCFYSVVWLYHSSAICLLLEIWIISILLLLHIKLWTSLNKCLCGNLFPHSKYLWVEWMGHVVGVSFIFYTNFPHSQAPSHYTLQSRFLLAFIPPLLLHPSVQQIFTKHTLGYKDVGPSILVFKKLVIY